LLGHDVIALGHFSIGWTALGGKVTAAMLNLQLEPAISSQTSNF
jgi:hypothetical protein